MAARRHARPLAAGLLSLASAVVLLGCAAAVSRPPTTDQRPPPVVVTNQPLTIASPVAVVSPSVVNGQPTAVVSPTAVASPSAVRSPVASASTPAAVQEIGSSAGGRPIEAYRLGAGNRAIVIVGGMHGGYEWNTILLANRLLDHFRGNPKLVPAAVTLYVIPNANPDGLAAVTGFDGPFEPADVSVDSWPGRFNGNGVDLNRNWDCNWTADALWRDQPVSGGAFPFSEPETRGLRDFLLAVDPAVVVFLHSAANAVYISGCPEPHEVSRDLALVYGQAAGYAVQETFDHYTITGDAGDWLTTQGIASFSVELYSHESLDWEQNLAGIMALLSHFDAE